MFIVRVMLSMTLCVAGGVLDVSIEAHSSPGSNTGGSSSSDLKECIGDLAAEIVVGSSVCVIATVNSADSIQPQLKRDAPGMLKSAHAVDLSKMDAAARSDMIRVRLSRFGRRVALDMVCESLLSCQVIRSDVER